MLNIDRSVAKLMWMYVSYKCNIYLSTCIAVILNVTEQ